MKSSLTILQQGPKSDARTAGGSRKVFDCKPLMNKDSRYRVLLEKDNFKNFDLDGWTVTWMGGAIDIAPEYLYQKSI